MKVSATTLALGALACAAACQATPMTPRTHPGFFVRTVVVGGVEHRYALYVPRDYTPRRRWPLVVFLNGRGECGTDGWRQTGVGLGPAIVADEQRWPFVVAFPQKPDRDSQWHEHGGLVLGVVRDVEATYYVDAERRFLTGISQGGAGTWALGARHADVFAAIAPVCGYGRPDEVAANLQHTPVWAFHGANDAVVPVQQSEALCAAVRAAGGAPLLTIYPETGHDSWTRAYRESGLAEWLRTVATEPVAARYLAAPDDLVSMRIEVSRYERAQQPAGEPSERGEVTIADGLSVLHASSPGEESRMRSEHRASVGPHPGTSTPYPTWQQAFPDEVERLLLAPLRALQRAGLFDRPALPAEHALLGPRLHLRITLRGVHGVWQHEAHVHDPGADATGIAAVLRRFLGTARAEVARAGK